MNITRYITQYNAWKNEMLEYNNYCYSEWDGFNVPLDT